jgi:hypothetical protein
MKSPVRLVAQSCAIRDRPSRRPRALGLALGFCGNERAANLSEPQRQELDAGSPRSIAVGVRLDMRDASERA